MTKTSHAKSGSFKRASARALHGAGPNRKNESSHHNKYAEHSRVPNLRVWGDSIAEDLARLPSRPVLSPAASASISSIKPQPV
jgi:hypothetical protein